ncbi:MAG TPA: DUF2637 domain-containing protein [Thermomonospora sp.]|nr:DUF2637 domain-containing protein [Thermomonospora sp.]
MAPVDHHAAPSPDGARHLDAVPPARRPTRAQRRLLALSAGLGVALLAGGTFVLTFDDLRELARAGGTAERWAPAYPVMLDALITVIILSLVAAREARWWSRFLRWALLVAVVAGAAAASVQRAVGGYGDLPEDRLRAGVAIAPYVMLVLVVWLWLTMFRQLQRTPASPTEPAPAVVPAPRRPEEPAAPPLALPAGRTDDTWLFGDGEDAEPPVPEDLPEPVPVESDAAPLDPLPEPRPGPIADPVTTVDVDDDPTPPGVYPAELPTDVELVRGHGRAPSKPAATTRPDIVMPSGNDLFDAPPPLSEDEHDEPADGTDRAEDADGGDGTGPRLRHLRKPRPADGPVPFHDDLIPDGDPPSGSLRSSPTPPQD